MSFKVEAFVDSEWSSNQLCFPTKDEADKYGKALWRAWVLVQETRTVESPEPANYRFIGPGNHDIEEIK
jgi:hypothetical protein